MSSTLFSFPVLFSLLTIVILLCRFPVHTAVASIGLAIVLDCLEIGKEGFDLGITIYPYDIACAILLCAGCIAIVRWRKLPSNGWWFAFGLFGLAVFNLIRGAAENGTKPAGNGIRRLTYLIVPSIAFMLLRPALRLDSARLAKWLSLAGLVFAGIAVCRWAGVLPSPEWSSQDNFREIPRVLNAESAMLLGQAFLAVLYLQIGRGFSWWGVTLAGTLGFELLFLQHRSVWMATIVGVTWLAIRTAGSSKRLLIGGAIGAICALAIWSAISPSVTNRFSTVIGENIEETEQSNSTWAWRTKGYEEALDRTFSGSTDEIWFGPPAGRNLSGASIASIYIHDRYVDTVVYYGILGEILFVIWLLFVARGVFGGMALPGSQDRGGQLGRVFLQALLLAQLTYFIPYSGGMPLGAVMGLLWVVSTIPPKAKATFVLVPAGNLPTNSSRILQTA